MSVLEEPWIVVKVKLLITLWGLFISYDVHFRHKMTKEGVGSVKANDDDKTFKRRMCNIYRQKSKYKKKSSLYFAKLLLIHHVGLVSLKMT